MKRMKRLLSLSLAVFMLIPLAPAANAAADIPLNDAGRWTEYRMQTSGMTAVCRMEVDPANTGDGSHIRIGPWQAGVYGARYRYKYATSGSIYHFPVQTGTIKGEYRTAGGTEGQAEVTIGFDYPLAVTPTQVKHQLQNTPDDGNFYPFEIPVHNIPKNTTGIQLGFGINQKTGGVVEFRNIVFSGEAWQAPDYSAGIEMTKENLYGKQSGAGNGAWQIKQAANGDWWLIRPDGRYFYSLGLDVPYVSQALVPYELDALRSISFNTIGGWSDVRALSQVNSQRGADAVPFLSVAFDTATYRSDFDQLSYAGSAGQEAGTHTFPDPFDPDFKARFKRRIAENAAAEVEGTVIGYFPDNELHVYEMYRQVYSPNCADAFVQYLQGLYHNDIAALNAAWSANWNAGVYGTYRSYTSFGEIKTRKFDPYVKEDPETTNDKMFLDFWNFRPVIIEAYCDVIVAAFREVYGAKPRPLLFTPRLTIDLYEWEDLLPIFARYFDAVALNAYPGNRSAGYSDAHLAIFDNLYAIMKKPIVITEWSVPAMDSGYYDSHTYAGGAKMDASFGEAVSTQAQRAAQASHVTMQLFNRPYIIGSSWLHWYDMTPADFGRSANRGIFKADGVTAWKELQTALWNTHKQITGEASPGPSDIDAERPAVPGTSFWQKIVNFFRKIGDFFRRIRSWLTRLFS